MEVKTGDQFLKDFFEKIQNDESLNSEVVDLLVELQKDGRLTAKNISNGLETIRKSKE